MSKKLSPQSAAALAADRIVNRVTTSYRAFGDDSDDMCAELFDVVVGETPTDALEPLLDKLGIPEDAQTELCNAAYDAAQRNRRFGYMLGIEVGRRLAGGSR